MSNKTSELSNLRCMVCTNFVGSVRIWRNKSVTCSDACHKEFLRRMKAIAGAKECPTCRRPSTPSERAAFRRFRQAENALGYDVMYPRLFKRFMEEKPGRTLEDFTAVMDAGGTIHSVRMHIHELKEGLGDNHADVVSALGGGVPSAAQNANAGPIESAVQDSGDEQDTSGGADSV